MLEHYGISTDELAIIDEYKDLINPAMVIPPDFYIYPPAFVPISVNPSATYYHGIWNYSFEGKEYGFVLFDFEISKFFELSQTKSQFFALIILKAIVLNDELTDDIREMAKELGVENVDEIDEYSLDNGDDISNLRAISQFRLKPPMICLEKDNRIKEIENRFSSSGKWSLIHTKAEFAEDVQFDERPLLDPGSKLDLFYRLLSVNEHQNAWIALNSKGWEIKEAAIALALIKDSLGLPFFDDLAENWINQSKNSVEWQEY